MIVSTLGGFMNGMKGRKKVDLSGLKCLVIDEADFFFADQKNNDEMIAFNNTYLKSLKNVQYVLFSATYTEDVKQKIGNIVVEA